MTKETKTAGKKYKFITIKPHSEANGKTAYQIVNNKNKGVLGVLYYHKPWNQYVFSQYEEEIIFNNECLKDIVDFMEVELN